METSELALRAKDDRSARGWTQKQLVQRLVKGIRAADSAWRMSAVMLLACATRYILH